MGGAGHGRDVACVGELPGVDRRDERLQVRLSRALGIQGLQARRGTAQEGRGVAAAPQIKRHLRAHALQLRAAELVEGAGVGGGQQRLRGQVVRRLELGAGGRQGT